jgi:hypothetical protein
VFELGKKGKLTVLHNFTNGSDGNDPGPVVLDRQGNLYGAAQGVDYEQDGDVFEIDTDGDFQVLHYFSGSSGTGDAWGANGPLYIDSAGEIFGTSGNGGADGSGGIFEISGGIESMIYSFTGRNPFVEGGFTVDPALKKGYLFGTTNSGGDNVDGSVFMIKRKARD